MGRLVGLLLEKIFNEENRIMSKTSMTTQCVYKILIHEGGSNNRFVDLSPPYELLPRPLNSTTIALGVPSWVETGERT